MGGFSLVHWIIVILVVVLLFGAGRVSGLMGDVAKGIKSFKKGMADDEEAEPRRHFLRAHGRGAAGAAARGRGARRARHARRAGARRPSPTATRPSGSEPPGRTRCSGSIPANC